MWFNGPTAGLVGGITGSVVGILGGTLGAIAGVFARKGKFKNFILAYAVVLIVISAILLCVGIFALATGQPYHVWYPFMLIGGLGSIQMPIFYIAAKKIYTKAELNKMSVDDL